MCTSKYKLINQLKLIKDGVDVPCSMTQSCPGVSTRRGTNWHHCISEAILRPLIKHRCARRYNDRMARQGKLIFASVHKWYRHKNFLSLHSKVIERLDKIRLCWQTRLKAERLLGNPFPWQNDLRQSGWKAE